MHVHLIWHLSNSPEALGYKKKTHNLFHKCGKFISDPLCVTLNSLFFYFSLILQTYYLALKLNELSMLRVLFEG